MKEQQPTYLGMRPVFIKRLLRGSAKCLPVLGPLLDAVTGGVLSDESAKAESEKIHKKLDTILRGQDHQEFDFAEILAGLHIQTDINETIRSKLEEIEQSLRKDDDSPFPDYFTKAIETIIGGNEQIRAAVQKLSDDHAQQSKEHEQINAKLDTLLAKSDINKQTKKAIEKIFIAILDNDNIPEWQWPDKLHEIAKRHQELLDKSQTIQSDDPAVDALKVNARRMIERGEYDNADKLLQEAVDIDRKAIQTQRERLDNRNLSLSRSLASRADLAETKLDYTNAIGLYKEAIESLPHNEQPLRSLYMNNLGLLYYTVAKYTEAEPLMRRALAIGETSFGKEHPKVATALNNLAQLLQAINRLKEAEPLYHRALAIDEKSFGKDHPEVAADLNNLAQLLQDTNRLKEAEPLMRRALAIDEKSFGKEHPNVAIDLNNLAQLLKATNRLKEAQPLYRRALTIFETRLGPDHPRTQTVRQNMQ